VSALVVKAAFYLLLRLWLDLFGPVVNQLSAWLLGWLGAAAVLWGSWNALWAPRLKLLAAYSTVAQLGYLFLFFSADRRSATRSGAGCGLRRLAAGPDPRFRQERPVPGRRGDPAAGRP